MEKYFTEYALKLKAFMWPFAATAALIFIFSFNFTELYKQYEIIGFTLVFAMLWTGSTSLLIYYYAFIGVENLGKFFCWYAKMFLTIWYFGLSFMTLVTPILWALDDAS